LWVIDNDVDAGYAALLHFAAGADGDGTPLATISGTKPHLSETAAIALSADGKHIWASRGPNAGSGELADLEEFSTASVGNVAPTRSIAGPSTKLEGNLGVALDALGNVWLASGDNNSLVRFGNGSMRRSGGTASGRSPRWCRSGA
jgi:hypothetical protein